MIPGFYIPVPEENKLVIHSFIKAPPLPWLFRNKSTRYLLTNPINSRHTTL
jgi:hypothetical protein